MAALGVKGGKCQALLPRGHFCQAFLPKKMAFLPGMKRPNGTVGGGFGGVGGGAV